ncbi:MAG: sugar phosphate isomerase/epimerase [Bryobacteraceae bacterium]
MTSQSRRGFLHNASLAAAAYTSFDTLRANPLNQPIGLQLYTVGEELGKDFNGTLKQIAAIGYKQVELAQTFNKSAAELRTAFADVGLTCSSAHIFDFQKTPAQFMDFAKELGVRFVVSSFNPPPGAMAALGSGAPDFNAFLKVINGMTLDDYKRSAETCNKLGEEASKHGLQYAYHNHNAEFKTFDGVTALDTLIASTDPELVKLEMDCGWVAVAGYDPVAYLKKYPKRIRLLHIKAFKAGPSTVVLGGPDQPEPTELGRGGIDYKPVFEAAKKAGVEHYYVEQEPPFKDMSAIEAAKVDYQFLHGLST